MEPSQFRLHADPTGIWIVCTICQAGTEEDDNIRDFQDVIKIATAHAKDAHECPLQIGVKP